MNIKNALVPGVLYPLGSVLCSFVLTLCDCPARAENPVQSENMLLGTREWQLTNPITPGWPTNQDATFPEIEGYASATSVNTNQMIEFYVDVRVPDLDPTYQLEFFRMGWYDGMGGRRMVWRDQSSLVDRVVLTSRKQVIPTPDPTTGVVECDWISSYVLQVPSDWVSGVYLGKLTALPSGKQSFMIFVVRQDDRPSDLLFQSSVTTFQAYNPWGGRSLYPYPGAKALQVSFNRPYAASSHPFSLPLDPPQAPREDLRFGSGAGEFFVTIGASPMPGWEYNMVRWLERQGFDVSYCTSIDTHTRTDLRWPRKSFKAFLSVGHDEYWSPEMRANVEAARNRGVNLGFFSANVCYWRAHLDPSSRRMTVRKENPLNFDLWRAPQNSPEVSLTGVSYIYNTLDMDMVVPDPLPQHWLYDHTSLKPLDRLPGLLGYEVDGELDVYPNRLEYAKPIPPPGTLRLMSTVFTNKVLQATGKSYATYYEAPSGAKVFSSGSMQWSWGLDDYNSFAANRRQSRLNPAAQQMTYNVLCRFTEDTLPTRPLSFRNADTTTRGDWDARYGVEGTWVATGGPIEKPASSRRPRLRIQGATPLLWSANPTDPRALRRPSVEGGRVAAAWSSPESFTIDVEFPDSATHPISLYCVDWSGAGLFQRIEVFDAAEPSVILDVRDFKVPTNGVHLTWGLGGHKVFRITNTGTSAESVAVVSGVFLGANGFATFRHADLGTETGGTRGDWVSMGGARRYGREGYRLVNGPTQLPPSLEVNPIGASASTWQLAALPSRGLRMVDTDGKPLSTRIAACWNSAQGGFSVDVAIHDAQAHEVSLYFLDWDGCAGMFPPRQQKVEVVNPNSNQVYDQRTLPLSGSTFCNGSYLTWLVRGQVRFRVTSLDRQTRPVLSGLFFDPDPKPICSIAPLPPTPRNARIDLGWDAIVGETYRVESTPDLSGTGWTVLSDGIVAAASRMARVIEVPLGGGNQFFRVVLDRDPVGDDAGN